MAGMRSTRALKTLYKYTCTVQVATLRTDADPYHPGSSNLTVDWSTIAASHTAIPCSWQRLDTRERATMGEVTGTGKAGTLIATDYLWIVAEDAPATLLDRDSIPAPELYHRITNIALRSDETLIDAGPFDIQRIVPEGSAGVTVKSELKRVQ